MPTHFPKKKERQNCKALTKAGNRCKAHPHKDGLCAFHADPQRAVELGRRGGRKNRGVRLKLTGNVVTAPRTAHDVKRLLGETMADVRNGGMDPKVASVLGYLGTALLRAIEIGDLAKRVCLLESKDESEGKNR